LNHLLIFTGGPALKLSAPDAAKIHVGFAIGIGKYCRVNTVTACNRLRLGFERTNRAGRSCYADMENIFFILYREVQVIGTVFISNIRSPKLPARPGNIFDIKPTPLSVTLPPMLSIDRI
jgi:hypothetical protein